MNHITTIKKDCLKYILKASKDSKGKYSGIYVLLKNKEISIFTTNGKYLVCTKLNVRSDMEGYIHFNNNELLNDDIEIYTDGFMTTDEIEERSKYLNDTLKECKKYKVSLDTEYKEALNALEEAKKELVLVSKQGDKVIRHLPQKSGLKKSLPYFENVFPKKLNHSIVLKEADDILKKIKKAKQEEKEFLKNRIEKAKKEYKNFTGKYFKKDESYNGITRIYLPCGNFNFGKLRAEVVFNRDLGFNDPKKGSIAINLDIITNNIMSLIKCMSKNKDFEIYIENNEHLYIRSYRDELSDELIIAAEITKL